MQMVAWLYIKSFSFLPAYLKVQFDIQNEIMCACVGGREGVKQQKNFKASHSFVFYLYLFRGSEMTNFRPDDLKRNVDRGLERLFSNSYQREGLVSRADRMFLL